MSVTRTRLWKKSSLNAGFGDELAADIFQSLVIDEVSAVSSDEQLHNLADVSVRAAKAFVERLLKEKD